MSNYPKVLVISHNVFSNTSNMGRTLANFFLGWPKDKIAQFYIHSEQPTTDVSINYFRVTDFDNIKKPKGKIGTVFGEADITPDLASERVDAGGEAKIYQHGRSRKPYMYLGRNFIWGLNRWYNKRLKAWLDEFSPEVIFFASGDYAFSYRIAQKIAKRFNIPIVTYVCDDFYFVKKDDNSFLYRLSKRQFDRTMKKLFSENLELVAICDKISEDYEKEFGTRSHTVMTTSTQGKLEKVEKEGKVKFSYIGNLGYDRHIQVADIGKTLFEVSGGEILLDVYSGEKKEEKLKLLTKENGIDFHGSIPYDEVVKVMQESDVLTHTESFDEDMRKKVRHSVSTKIADSLSTGKCLFAYGPDDVASMEYLAKNDAAYCVTEKDKLSTALKELIENEDLRKEYAKKAEAVAEKFHNMEENCKKIKKILSDACTK